MSRFITLLFLILTLGAGVVGTRATPAGATPLHSARVAQVKAQRLHQPTPAALLNVGTTNCRVGVSIGGGGNSATQRDWVPAFRVGWYLSFSADAGGVPSNVEFTPMIGVHQPRGVEDEYLPGYITNFPLTPTGLGLQIARNPGALWIVGNEVERIDQGDIFPREYAVAYHDIYHFIKRHDPTAQVAPSGLVQVTPGRLQYLDIVYDTYQQLFGTIMPVDAWTMHIYILPELNPQGEANGIASIALGTDPALGKRESNGDPTLCADDDVYCFAEHDDMNVFAGQVVAMREWMRDHGYMDKPLLLSEYSLLYTYEIDPESCFLQDEFGNCFTPERVAAFIENSFDYLNSAAVPGLGMAADNHRLVQQWLWYSLNASGAGKISNLLNDDFSGLSYVGEVFQDNVLSLPLAVNLFPQRANAPVVFTDGTGTADATLSVEIRNNGSTYVNSTFLVSFFNADTNAFIGATSVPALDGCARDRAQAHIVWKNLPPGIHRFYARVDPVNIIPESNELDNAIFSQVFVDPAAQIFLPSAWQGIRR